MNKSTLSLLALTAAVLCALTVIRAHAAATNLTIYDAETGDPLCMDAVTQRADQRPQSIRS